MTKSSARSGAAHSSSATASTAKTPAQLERDIADALWTKVKVRSDWPETWERLMNGWWYTLERRPNGGWSVGFSRRRGDPDVIDRGSTFSTRDAAAHFAETHARI